MFNLTGKGSELQKHWRTVTFLLSEVVKIKTSDNIKSCEKEGKLEISYVPGGSASCQFILRGAL